MSSADFKAIHVRVCGNCNTNNRHQNGACKLCTRTEIKAWKKANPEKQAQLDADHQDAIRAKDRAYAAEQYAKNPDRQIAASAKWLVENKEKKRTYDASRTSENNPKLRAARSAHYEANKEKLSAYNSEYRKNNRDLMKTHDHNYRARKLANGGKLSSGITVKLFKLQKGKCACCGLLLGKGFHLDHIQPLALGGPNIDSNVQLLRQRCNNQKGKLDPLVFMRRRGFLL